MSDAPAGRTAGRGWAYAAFGGLLSGLLCWAAYALPPASTSDFELFWVGARALLTGEDPYAVVPAATVGYPAYYPLTTFVLAVPFALLPFSIARVLFAALGGAAFTWAALRYGRGLPAALLSANFLNAVVQGQWAPLLIAAAIVPALSWLLAAKPSVGAALFAAFPRRQAVIGGIALLVVSLVVDPTWTERWRESFQVPVHVAPIVKPGGFVLLLAWIRWRQPEGRLLGMLACVPQITGLYDTLALFLIPRTRWQGYALAGLSYVAAFGQAAAAPRTPGMPLEAMLAARWPFILCCLYLPALVMVLMTHQPADSAPQGGPPMPQGM